MTENHHLTVEDAARRDRLDCAMSTRAARWCAEQVAAVAHALRERGRTPEPASTSARHFGDQYAFSVVERIYVKGWDPGELMQVDDARKARALHAWAALHGAPELYRPGKHPLPLSLDKDMETLEAADVDGTWQLESERIAR